MCVCVCAFSFYIFRINVLLYYRNFLGEKKIFIFEKEGGEFCEESKILQKFFSKSINS